MQAGETAFKIVKFIKRSTQLSFKHTPRLPKKEYPSTKVVKDSKWQTHPTTDGTADREGLFGRCLTGIFGNHELPTISDVRSSSTSLWKKTSGVNMYGMVGNHFLFEFPNRNIAKQILQGD